jgi:hypothetical protein
MGRNRTPESQEKRRREVEKQQKRQQKLTKRLERRAEKRARREGPDPVPGAGEAAPLQLAASEPPVVAP